MMQPARPWMWDARPREESRCDQLVVRGEQRRRAVENANSLRVQLGDDPQPLFDAVETWGDIEPVQGDITGAQIEQRITGCEQVRVRALPAAGRESHVRVRQLVGDDGEVHAVR